MHSRSAAVGSLVEFLRSLPELRQSGPIEFCNAAGFPWLCLTLVQADSAGNYSSNGLLQPTFNKVQLICSAGEETLDAVKWYESIAGRIAAFLGWEADDEDNDDLIV